MFKGIAQISVEDLRNQLRSFRSVAQLDNPDLYDFKTALEVLDFLRGNSDSAGFTDIADFLNVGNRNSLGSLLTKLVRGNVLSLNTSYRTTSGDRSISGKTYSLTSEAREFSQNARGYLAIIGSDPVDELDL